MKTEGLLVFLLGVLAFSSPAARSVAQSQQPLTAPQTGQAQRSIPIEHYYWHFLIHQNDLDNWAAAAAAKGHDGSALRDHIQKSVRLSDADYAIVRASSVRLAAEAKDLNAQAASIRALGPSSENSAKLQSLAAQREADMKAEVTFLKANLSAEKIARLEAFMVQFFSVQSAPAVQPQPTAAVPQ